MAEEFFTDNAKETEAVGYKIGESLKGSEVIVLKSDLGGGKTTLVSGIAAGAGSKDTVASPSFTIDKLYKTPSLNIYHFDFYRLNEPGLMLYELRDLLKDPKVVIIIEWSDIVSHVLPKRQLDVEIIPMSETKRKLTFKFPNSLAYLTEKI